MLAKGTSFLFLLLALLSATSSFAAVYWELLNVDINYISVYIEAGSENLFYEPYNVCVEITYEGGGVKWVSETITLTPGEGTTLTLIVPSCSSYPTSAVVYLNGSYIGSAEFD